MSKKTDRVKLKSTTEIRKLAKRVGVGHVADVQLYMIVSFMTRNVETVAHRRAIIRDDLGCVKEAGGEIVPIFGETDIKSSRQLWLWLDALTPDTVAELPLTDGQKVVLVEGIATTKKGGTPSAEFGRTFTRKGLHNIRRGDAGGKTDYEKMIGFLHSASRMATKGQFSDSEFAFVELAVTDLCATLARRRPTVADVAKDIDNGEHVDELDIEIALAANA